MEINYFSTFGSPIYDGRGALSRNSRCGGALGRGGGLSWILDLGELRVGYSFSFFNGLNIDI